MKQTYRRIWLDQDNTIYDLSKPWYDAHNKDYPQHDLRSEHIKGWDTQQVCNNAGCKADIYSYFNRVELWRDGGIIEGAKEVIDQWRYEDLADLGIVTTASNGMSMPYKIEWLQKHFPYIEDIIMTHKTHVKHLLRGDILIDDGIHNLTKWQGVGILYTQPWNEDNTDLPRANNWKEVDIMVRDAIELLDKSFSHDFVQMVLAERYNKV